MEKSSALGLRITAAARSVKQMAYETLRASIMDSTLQPGQALTEEALAREFSISRTPVREALLELAREGLVRLEPRHGARVAEISIQHVHEVYELREVLERFAVAQAVRLMPDDVLAKTRVDYEAAAGEVQRGHLESFMEFDRRFHNLIAQYSGNLLIHEALMRVYDQAWRVRTYFVHNRQHVIDSCREHEEIMLALEARDGSAAADAIGRHDAHVRQRIVDLLMPHSQ